MTVRHLALTFFVFALFGCQSKRFESAAPGQPTMHELAQRRHERGMEMSKREEAIRERAKSLSTEEAQSLLASLKATPTDKDTYTTLFQHYQMAGDRESLDALALWYIEHQPDGPIWIGNIDSHLNPKGYKRGRALWLANVKRPGAKPVIFERAARYLESSDRPVAEAVLRSGMKAYPEDRRRWTHELAIHYAQAIAGTGEPFTDLNVIRVANSSEQQTPYAKTVRERLAGSNRGY